MPPLEPLVRDGLISGIGEVPVATRISELFSDPDGMRAQAQRGRQFFIDELSYGATLERLAGVFAGLEDGRRATTGEVGPRLRTCAEHAVTPRARPGSRRARAQHRRTRHRHVRRGGDRGLRVRSGSRRGNPGWARDGMGVEPRDPRVARRCAGGGGWPGRSRRGGGRGASAVGRGRNR